MNKNANLYMLINTLVLHF